MMSSAYRRALRNSVRGHLWTVVPHLSDSLRPLRLPGRSWSTSIEDEKMGTVRLRGVFHKASPRDLAVVVHGMGGHADKGYVLRAATQLLERGISVLRLTLRGSGGDGEDLYHAGLTEDLSAALSSPELREFERVYIVGFSLGGHMVLRHALTPDARVRAVAAVCSPLHLAESCAFIDRPSQALYRLHLLRGLRGNFAQVARRRPDIAPPGWQRIRSIREWDHAIVAPRFGFASAADYYQQVSVGPRLGELACPSYLLLSEQDPMVRTKNASGLRSRLPSHSLLHVGDGGHVHFRGQNRDSGGPFAELIDWLLSK